MVADPVFIGETGSGSRDHEKRADAHPFFKVKAKVDPTFGAERTFTV